MTNTFDREDKVAKGRNTPYKIRPKMVARTHKALFENHHRRTSHCDVIIPAKTAPDVNSQ
jgi:hypothetical protein